MALSKNHTREMIEAIKLEREQVANEMDRLEDKLYALEATLATYGVKTLRPRPKKQQPKSEPPSQGLVPIDEEPDYDYKGLTQADAAYRYLVEKGEAAHVDEIVDALLRRGIALKGDEKQPTQEKRRTTLKQSLVSTLIRDPERFRNLGRNRFHLVYELPALPSEEDSLSGFENIEEQEDESVEEAVEDSMFEREYE